ncbi:hypothetical protein GCM10010433_71670 [Streptomyces pulveraceus]|uniref:Core-binding (CB) domain-containing protein n=1 Tax=Streptomyces pulveraceus TaxID=68258 RepID=A0ABW1GEG7_9ACTN
MDLFFVRRPLVERYGDGLAGGTAVALLDRQVIPDGMPIVLGSDMRPVEPLSSWFRHLAYLGRVPETMRSYAYVVLRLAEYLASRQTNLLAAGEVDLLAYRRQRLDVQAVPIDPVTWDREASTVNGLFAWLTESGHRSRGPLRMPKAYGSGMSHGMQVRHLALEQYLFFRDVGLGGQCPDGEVDVAFRGGFPHRNRAGAELALMTGMRKREWSTVLLPELVRRPEGPAEFPLQACAKGGRRRKVYVPSAPLDLVDTYQLLERAEIVERAAARLARRHRELFVIDGIDDLGRLSGVLEGRRRTFAMARMPAELRRITVRECDGGLEAMAVFLGQGGLMLGPSSWDRIRRHAWERMSAFAERGPARWRTPLTTRRVEESQARADPAPGTTRRLRHGHRRPPPRQRSPPPAAGHADRSRHRPTTLRMIPRRSPRPSSLPCGKMARQRPCVIKSAITEGSCIACKEA